MTQKIKENLESSKEVDLLVKEISDETELGGLDSEGRSEHRDSQVLLGIDQLTLQLEDGSSNASLDANDGLDDASLDVNDGLNNSLAQGNARVDQVRLGRNFVLH